MKLNPRPLVAALLDARFLIQAQEISRMFEAEKRNYLASIANEKKFEVFVETGTYLGETAESLAAICGRVVTIEFDPVLYNRAAAKFSDHPHITVLLGDSGQLLPTVLAELSSPALFWLDAHCSGGITSGHREAPIIRELTSVLQHPVKEHVIVIDDARLFRGRNGYPQLRQIVELVQRTSSYRIGLFGDLIRIQSEDI
jgi:hypothetical protein